MVKKIWGRQESREEKKKNLGHTSMTESAQPEPDTTFLLLCFKWNEFLHTIKTM